jgi:hypothetical protein
MNIDQPSISRTLAILIQPVIADDREKFLEGAERAENMEDFMKTLKNYRTTRGHGE